jgi:hypothetical protein
VWCVFLFLFELDLQISLNGFEKKQIKEKEKKEESLPVLLAAWRPARTACLTLLALMGRPSRSRPARSSPRHVGRPSCSPRARFPL